MQLPKHSFITVLLLSSLLQLGCASTARQEGAGEYVDNSVITARVKAAILDEPTLHVAEINVETYKGVVQLSGFASSPAEIAKAGQLARGIEGVTSVRNDMQLK